MTNEEIAGSFYSIIKTIYQFSRENIVEKINQKEITDKKGIITVIYLRIHNYIYSILDLNNLVHFQAIANIARSVFELFIDLKLIYSDIIPNAVKKYLAFVNIERKKRLLDIHLFVKKYPDSRMKTILKQDENELKKSIELSVIDAGYTHSNIKHWSGMKFHKIVELFRLPYEEMYYYFYPIFSFYVHPEATGVLGINHETYDNLVISAYIHLCLILIESINKVDKTYNLSEIFPDFNTRFQGLIQQMDELKTRINR